MALSAMLGKGLGSGAGDLSSLESLELGVIGVGSGLSRVIFSVLMMEVGWGWRRVLLRRRA